MLLGEPPRTQYDLNFSFFGIPIRVHPFFWLIALLMGSSRKEPLAVLIWIVAVFLAILVHELGHALVMRAYGFYPWITLYGMGGLTSHNQGHDGYSKGSGALAQVLISLAGPAAGFLLAAVLVLGLMLTGGFSNPRLADLIGCILFICIVWGVINLLPIYPLDGGQIAREIFLKLSPQGGIQYSLMLSVVAAILTAIAGFILLHDLFVVLLFGYFAFTSYATLQAYRGRNPW
jgi:Zn-dependent protease